MVSGEGDGEDEGGSEKEGGGEGKGTARLGCRFGLELLPCYLFCCGPLRSPMYLA